MEQLKLPTTLINKGDLLRLMRELNTIDDFFVGAKARAAGETVQMPKLSKMMEQLVTDNKINLLTEADRKSLEKTLNSVAEKAPSLHFSFASEPSPKALQPLVVWLRENIHPQALISVGYQPAIAAGCVLRTPNKIFDMSLGAHLQKQAPLLMHFLAGSINGS